MLKAFGSMFKVLFDFLKWPLLGVAIVSVVLVILYFVNWFIFYCKGMRPLKGEHYRLRKRNVLQKLFVDAPRQYALDRMRMDPEFFKYQGMYIFCGDQGAGKTISMIEFSRRMQREYPKSKCISNCCYKYQDEELTHWHQLIDYKNDKQGVIVQLDEIHNWFSSLQSKDFPPEMLEVICQNRKNRRVILGTAQRFNRVAKPIREQTTYVCECHTFAGCFTVVHVKRPLVDSEGKVEKYKSVKWYCFAHDDDLRAMYDTYHVIESLRQSGFKEQGIPATDLPVINLDVASPKRSKRR